VTNVAAATPSGNNQIEELRRRIQEDPAPFLFAQLAEAYRRERQQQQAIDCALAGLDRHPYYLSLRVSLGKALADLGRLDEAKAEFERVLQVAPDNLMARRGLAEVCERQPAPTAELDQVLRALGLPDHQPPPAVERLLAETPTPVVAPAVDVVSAESSPDDLLAALEQRLRTYEATRSFSPDPPVVASVAVTAADEEPVRDASAAILGELEAWLAAIDGARSGRTGPST
jgi:tetratricopeptide (TPR) repeat protein